MKPLHPSLQVNIRGGRLPTAVGDAALRFRVDHPIDGLT